jgi:RNA methyltransferase, TrmH family
MERIASRQNAAVRRFRDVRSGDVDGLVLLDGEHLLEEALRSGVAIEAAAFSDHPADAPLARLAARAHSAGARIFGVSASVLAAMSPVRQPSGVVAIAARPRATLATVLDRRPQLVLFLGGVQDPGNVGAIVRAAEAFGATGIVSGESTADPWSWKALRGSMGSAFRLPIAAHQPLTAAAARARAEGLRVLATVPHGGTPLSDTDLRGPAAILLGGEGAGIGDELLAVADERLSIPMRDPVESLNVAVAAAVIVYEAARQRGSRP